LSGRTIVYALSECGSKWDPRKAAANLRRHKVSFAEAVTVLEDEYTYRGPDIIRVISAWKAKRRQKEYMKRAGAEKYRDIDFSRAKRGAIVKAEPGKTKIRFGWTTPS
jgi:hypothetical protein